MTKTKSTRRLHRYVITMTMNDGYVETGAFSRRIDAIKRAAQVTFTWRNLQSVTVVDTYTGERIA